MVKVFFQDKKGIHSELIAVFKDEELYKKCQSSLIGFGKEHRLEVTESIEDDNYFITEK